MFTPVDHPDPRIRCAFMAHICARAVATARTADEVTERLKLARSYINLAWRVDRAERRARKGKNAANHRTKRRSPDAN
jgi:hypothetical protein